jgi:hypothetical protein
VVAVSRHLDEWEPVEMAVVHFDGTDRLDEYRSFHRIPERVRLLADPDRAAYQALGIGRGSWWRVWGPATLAAYLRLMRRGRRFHRHRGDSLQLGADVVVAPGGRVAWTAAPQEPDARPSVEEIGVALEAARA